MNAIRNLLSGRKTHATGLALIALGIAKMFMPDLPIEGDFAEMIGMGLGLIFMRQGIAKNGMGK